MKRTALVLLCILFLLADSSAAYAQTAVPGDNDLSITAEVPDTHHLTVNATGNVTLTVNGKTGTEFDVERLSRPQIEIKPTQGFRIMNVSYNGSDYTNVFANGSLFLDPVYEDKVLVFDCVTEPIPIPDTDTSGEDTESKPDTSSKTTSSKETSSSRASVVSPKTGAVTAAGILLLVLAGSVLMILISSKRREGETR